MYTYTILAGVTDPEEARFYVRMICKWKILKKIHQVQKEGFFFVTETTTAIKSEREVEKFITRPNRIKRIEQGEVLVISRMVNTRYGLVGIPRARVLSNSVCKGRRLRQK